MGTHRMAAGGLAALLAVSGCALRDREWGSCAIGGGLVGGTVGGIAAGAALNNTGDPSNGEMAGAIVGSAITGALIGAILGHAACDPLKERPAPPPPPPPPPAPEKIGTLRGAHFAFDSAELSSEGQRALQAAIDRLRREPTLRVTVEGYTDSVGSDAYNIRLSERRALAVKDYLVRQGIEAARITARGFGKANPVASNATEAGRAENRRVELVVQ